VVTGKRGGIAPNNFKEARFLRLSLSPSLLPVRKLDSGWPQLPPLSRPSVPRDQDPPPRTCCRSGGPVSFPLGGAANCSLYRTLAAAKSRYLCSALMINHLTCDICRSFVHAHPGRPTAAVSSSIRNTRNVYGHRLRAVALSFISRNERDRVIAV